LVSWYESEAYEKFLGAYKGPPGKAQPPSGWWCQGDASKAKRWIDGKWCSISCPHRLCEYSLDGSGSKGVGTWCKPHLSLVAQLDWDGDWDGLPRLIFQWDSQSWNNVANLDGMFGEINGLAEHMGYQQGKFPIIGLAFVAHLKERVKAAKGRRFPEVSFSTEGDRMAWMGKNHQLALNDQAKLLAYEEQPKLLGAAPPPQCTQEQMQEAAEAALSPNYQPRNVRAETPQEITVPAAAVKVEPVPQPEPPPVSTANVRTIFAAFDKIMKKGKVYRYHTTDDDWLESESEDIARFIKSSGKGASLQCTIVGTCTLERVTLAGEVNEDAEAAAKEVKHVEPTPPAEPPAEDLSLPEDSIPEEEL
jgi:hypothetical protein